MTRIIAYLRVSTQKQGNSGLGLEAQRVSVETFARNNNGQIIETFVEIESGKNCDRPQLAAALGRCKALGATLCVAKLDRLARDVAFIATLMRDGVDFVACDMPHANRLTLHILAAVGEDEARRISERTKVALQAAKARGTRLGGFRGGPVPSTADRVRGNAVKAAAAKARALALGPVLAEIRVAGAVTLAAMADALNGRGVPAPRGGLWRAVQVGRVLALA